jgi:hypothetical protein
MKVLSRGKSNQDGFILCKVYVIARFAIPFGRRVSRLSVWPGFGKAKWTAILSGSPFCFGGADFILRNRIFWTCPVFISSQRMSQPECN